MRKFRIKEITYVNGNVKYYIQRRYLGFIWLNVQMPSIDYLSKKDRYLSDIVSDVSVSTTNLDEAKNIKKWLEIDKYNQIGYDNNGQINYIYWLELEAEHFAPIYLGSNKFDIAVEKRNEYINNLNDVAKRKKVNYIY